MIIRTASRSDVPSILAVEQEAATAGHWTAEAYQQLVDAGCVLLAEEHGELRGFLCARAVDNEWELENVVVSAAFHRRGIADALVRELLDRVRTKGEMSVWLEVRETNAAARGLYEKHGFRETGRRRMYYKDPSEDAILYSFRLGTDKSDGR